MPSIMGQIETKKQFDPTYPSSDSVFSGSSFRTNFHGLYGGDFIPFRPLQSSPPSMKIMLMGSDAVGYQNGVYWGVNSQRIALVSGDSPIMGKPASNPRIDVIYVTPSGNIMIKSGDEAGSPTIPDISESGDRFPVCAIYHRTTSAGIYDFVNKGFHTGDSYIMADLRPMYRVPRSGVTTSLQAEIDRNIRNIMLNRLNIMQNHSMAFGQMIDGWNDDFYDSTGIVPSYYLSGDLVSVGDKLRYSRNYVRQGTPAFNVAKQMDTVAIDSNTLLLLHCDGADGSTTFTDSSPSAKSVVANGNAQIDTAQSKFGGASGLFDGTGDYLTVADSADWDFADYTIDWWFRPAVMTNGVRYGFFDRNNGAEIGIERDTGNNLQLSIEGASNDFGTFTPAVGVWVHIAITRSGTSNYCFIDGVQLGTAWTRGNAVAGTTGIEIGGRNGGATPINGWIDEFRISNIARWTANFTPPTFAYGSLGNGGAGGDGKMCIVVGPYGTDYYATKATILAVSQSGENLTAEISRNSGANWDSVPLSTDFYDGKYYYRSGKNESLSGTYPKLNTGDYFVTFVVPSGFSPNTSLEAYGVTLG